MAHSHASLGWGVSAATNYTVRRRENKMMI